MARRSNILGAFALVGLLGGCVTAKEGADSHTPAGTTFPPTGTNSSTYTPPTVTGSRTNIDFSISEGITITKTPVAVPVHPPRGAVVSAPASAPHSGLSHNQHHTNEPSYIKSITRPLSKVFRCERVFDAKPQIWPSRNELTCTSRPIPKSIADQMTFPPGTRNIQTRTRSSKGDYYPRPRY